MQINRRRPPVTFRLMKWFRLLVMLALIRGHKRRHQLAANLAECAESEAVMGDRIEIQVTDTGLGIDVKEQGRIFEPYYQGRAGQQSSDSTGLGLAITHQMVKMLQGSIHLKSEPDIGSTFTITLPMRYQQKEVTEQIAAEMTVDSH